MSQVSRISTAALTLVVVLGGATFAHAANVGRISFSGNGPGPTAVKSYELSVTNTPTGGATFEDLTFAKPINATGSEFLQATVTGDHFASAVLDLAPVPMVLCFGDVQLSAYRQRGSSSQTPSEEVSMRYDTLEILFDLGRALGAPAAARGAC